MEKRPILLECLPPSNVKAWLAKFDEDYDKFSSGYDFTLRTVINVKGSDSSAIK